MKRPIYYDTETTGVNAKQDRIIEIAAYDPEQDRTFESLINPGMPIPPSATAIHNITDEMVSEANSFKKVGLDFATFCEGETVLIAHNNDGFDKHFLAAEYERNDLPLPDWTYLDTLKWSRKYRPDLPKHTLQHLRELYGFPANNAHRALDDVIVLHQVFSAMIDDLSIDTCLMLMNQKTALLTMPFGKHRGKPIADVPKDYVAWLLDNGALDKPDNKELKESFAAADLLPN